MKLILVRHGETQKNTSELLHAPNDPETLDEKGVKQMEATAKFLLNLKPQSLYSSNSRRAIQSGKILSQTLAIPLSIVDGFQERSWGALSGKSWPEIKKLLDLMTLEERYIYQPQQGESWKNFETRLANAIESIIAANPNKTAVIILHGGAIRALIPYLLKVPRDESFKYDPDNASLTVFNSNANGIFINEGINDTSHLPEDLKSIRAQ